MAATRVKRTIKSSTSTNKVISIGEAFNGFEREKIAKGLAQSTLYNYRLTITKFVEHNGLEDNSPITAITKDVILNWINALQKESIRATSINHFIRDLRAFFNWCMADERKYLPMFKIDSVKTQEARPKAFAKDDLKILLQKPEGKEDLDFVAWRTWAVVNLALDMGARAASISEIQLGDINFQTNTIYLRHTKNKKLAHQNISSACAKALKEYINLYRAYAEDDEYLFCNVEGNRMSYNALSHSFRRYAIARGVSQYNLHGLRHSFATTFAENTNGDMIKLQKALGHSSIDMAQKYVDIAAIDIGNYDSISPLATTKGSNKGAPSRKVRRAS